MASKMTAPDPDPERVAVIVGVGQINDRQTDPTTALSPLDLMTTALADADKDAGGGWLTDVHSVAVVQQIGFPQDNPLVATLCQAIGAKPSISYESAGPSGDSPILLLAEAASRIARGEIGIAVIVGGEALWTASRRAATAARTGVEDQNPLRNLSKNRPPGYRQRYGLSAPVDVYPLYENAVRAFYGQSLEEGQHETGEIWARMSDVAAASPGAWLREPRSIDEIVEPSPANRPIAFPYTKLMVANSSVNQGAGFVVASLVEARKRGVPSDRLIYVGHSASAHEAGDFLARDRYDRSAGMEICLRRTLERNRVVAADLDLVELYSCFPCVPKMARRVIGWPIDSPISVFGGLTFGGGPIGNYMSHAVVEMVHRLRRQKGKGLLFANGGYATHNHAIVLANEPLPGSGVEWEHDCQAEADSLRDPVPDLIKGYAGPATIETYTVFYGRDGSPTGGVIVALDPLGRRTLARVPGDDAVMLSFLIDGNCEPVGSAGEIVAGGDMTFWRSL